VTINLMARPRNADGQRTRQAILDAALRLFGEKGYFGTTLRDVASAVGVRESALYNYFPGKEALFEALLTAHAAEKTQRLSAILDGPVVDGRATLERLTIEMLDAWVTPGQSQLFRILMSDGLRLARDGRINLLERMNSSRPRLDEVMRHLAAERCLRTDADTQVLAMEFLGPLLLWRHFHAIGAVMPVLKNRRAFARAHVDHFLRGAAAAPRRASAKARRTRPAPAS
jgi:AcrR family transcriptional regulator